MMKTLPFYLSMLLLLSITSCSSSSGDTNGSLPSYMKGAFEDDYGIQYLIKEKVFIMKPNATFHVLSVDTVNRSLIAQNDSLNEYAPLLFTRIDYQKLEGMAPYEWAFCFSNYEEATYQEALNKVNPQRSNLMGGCNGYPFTRMKRTSEMD